MIRKFYSITKLVAGFDLRISSVMQYIWMDDEEKEITERYFKDNNLNYTIQEII